MGFLKFYLINLLKPPPSAHISDLAEVKHEPIADGGPGLAVRAGARCLLSELQEPVRTDPVSGLLLGFGNYVSACAFSREPACPGLQAPLGQPGLRRDICVCRGKQSASGELLLS